MTPHPRTDAVLDALDDRLLELDAEFVLAFLDDAPVASHIAAEGISA